MIKEMLAALGSKSRRTGAKEFGGIQLGGLSAFAGIDVTTVRAMQHAAVFAAVRDKSETVGQLPVEMFRRNPKDGKTTRVFSGREHRIFTRHPNEFQTMNEFIEMAAAWLELQGNFYAYIERNKYGNISEIIPFFDQRSVGVSADNGRPYYSYVTNDGKGGMIRDWFTDDNILHIKLFAYNGYKGLSPIANNARALGVSMAQEEYLGSLMESGALPLGVLMTDNVFKDDEAVKRVREGWTEKFGGIKNAGKTPLLENGLKYHNLSISPADSELILQRRFSREEICSIFKVPYSRLYPQDKAGGTSTVEQDNIKYLTTGLMPVIKKIERAISDIMPDGLEIALDVKDFLRGDIKVMQEVLGNTFKLGSISMNELRVGLGFPEKEGGDVHAIDTNNLTFGLLTDIPKLQEQAREQAQAQPSAAKPDKDEEVEDEA